jgi:hypothetical protein
MSKKKRHSKSSVRPRPVPAPPEREKKLPNAFRREVVLVALFLFFISFLYWNSLKNDFINWDDQMIYGNQAIRSLDWRNVLQMFVPGKGTYQPIPNACPCFSESCAAAMEKKRMYWLLYLRSGGSWKWFFRELPGIPRMLSPGS